MTEKICLFFVLLLHQQLNSKILDSTDNFASTYEQITFTPINLTAINMSWSNLIRMEFTNNNCPMKNILVRLKQITKNNKVSKHINNNVIKYEPKRSDHTNDNIVEKIEQNNKLYKYDFSNNLKVEKFNSNKSKHKQKHWLNSNLRTKRKIDNNNDMYNFIYNLIRTYRQNRSKRDITRKFKINNKKHNLNNVNKNFVVDMNKVTSKNKNTYDYKKSFIKTIKVNSELDWIILEDVTSSEKNFMVKICLIYCDGKKKISSKWYKIPSTILPDPPSMLSVWTEENVIYLNWKTSNHDHLINSSNPKNEIKGYIIGYGEGTIDIHFKFFDVSVRNASIKDLKYATMYMISLRSFNDIGRSDALIETLYTKERRTISPKYPVFASSSILLSAPTKVKMKLLSERSLLLNWFDPSLGESQQITDERFYGVYYQLHPGGKTLSEVVKALKLTIFDLLPNSTYLFKIQTIKGNIVSGFTDDIFIKTSFYDTKQDGLIDYYDKTFNTNQKQNIRTSVSASHFSKNSFRSSSREKSAHNELRAVKSESISLKDAFSSIKQEIKTKRHDRIKSNLNNNPNNQSHIWKHDHKQIKKNHDVVFNHIISVKINAIISWSQNSLRNCLDNQNSELDYRTENSYLFRYRKNEILNSEYEIVERNVPFIILEDLEANSSYQYQVSYIFKSNEETIWSQNGWFKT